MNKYKIDSPYYVVFKNDECVEQQLPKGVTFKNGHLSFQNKEREEVQLIYLITKSTSLSYVIEPSTEVDIIETHYIENNATFNKTITIQNNAIVHFFKENLSSNKEKVFLEEDVSLYRDAFCQVGYAELSDGSYNARFCYDLEEENACVQVRMAALSKLKEDKTFEIVFNHNAKHTQGQMDNYGVVKEQGSLQIDSIGRISKGQKQAETHQTNKIMVFDPLCKASANPYLYIDEYDVKASHAAGVGKMDEDHLYYLQSRGLTKSQAMQLITYGYLKPVVDVIENEMIKKRFLKALDKVGA